MNKEELAKLLDRREIGYEISHAEAKQAKDAGLVVVYGASDDLMELRGAIDDEFSAYGGTVAKVDKDGIFPDWDTMDDANEGETEKWFERKKRNPKTIEQLWCKEEGYSWTFKTDIPHSEFEILEDGGHYCRGIVFALADL